MRYKRSDYVDFLESEYNSQIREYGRLIETKALILKERGDIFVGRFVGFKDEFSIFKVRISDNMPRKNSFWTASCLIGKMTIFKNWGDLSWASLRESYQSNYSDAYCAWISKSEEVDFCLVGVKNITIDFAELLKSTKPIIAFGPKEPPLQYLLNLQEFVKNQNDKSINRILDYDLSEKSVWNPKTISFSEDLNLLIENSLETSDTIAIQGPPGTGKTYRMAKLISKFLSEGKSVLATALANETLINIASKDVIKPYLKSGKVTKTGLTVDEWYELPLLVANKDGLCNAMPGYLSLATFYVASGWAKNMNNTVPFDCVIVDEASQALLPMIAASKKLGKKVIWIGDQKQLSPIVVTNEDIINTRKWNSIIKGFDTICNNITMPTYMLIDTFRLNKRSAEFSSIFYDNALNSIATINQEEILLPEFNQSGGPTLIKLDLEIGDKKPENAISVIFDLTERILLKNNKLKIAILAKFKETVKELQRFFLIKLNSDEILKNIKIETIDRIQGITVDYTFFLIPNVSINHSLEPELFNVATSRAKYCTVIVTDRMILKNYMSADVRRYLMRINDVDTKDY